MVSFFVAGTPAPKGSKKAFRRPSGKICLVESAGVKLKSWSSAVAEAACLATQGVPAFFKTPITVEMVFALERPLSHTGKRGLKPSAPIAPHVKPDVDKLVRATLDPMSNIVFDDDARIVALRASEVYARPGQPPGVFVSIQKADALDISEREERYAHGVTEFLRSAREGIV